MSASRIAIRAFEPGDAAAFRDINLEWIERFFIVEAKDRETLEQAQARIIDPGGAILMAVEDDIALGCVALIVMDGDTVELAKMGVRPAAQGKGVGRMLVAGAIVKAREMGAGRDYLETNSALGPALKLYSDAGFVPAV